MNSMQKRIAIQKRAHISKRRILPQDVLDEKLRQAARPHAIEAMTLETSDVQIYRLDDGTLLVISKHNGRTRRVINQQVVD